MREGAAFAAGSTRLLGGGRSHAVLNSLSLDLLAASFAALGEGGAFEEIGKRGVWSSARHAASAPTTAKDDLFGFSEEPASTKAKDDLFGFPEEPAVTTANDQTFDPFGLAAASPAMTEIVSEVPPDPSPETEFDKLDTAEFLRLFGMDRASFEKLPRWKQVDAKRRASLL